MKNLIIEGEQKAIEYAVKRFNNAFNTHHINDETCSEIENTLNRLTNTIYNTNNQKIELYLKEYYKNK
mgnify:FL=1